MRTTMKLALAALFVSTAALAAPEPSATVGNTAPNIKTLDAISGKEFDLNSLKGKPVVLEWNNFGCPFVKKHYDSGNMQDLQKAAIADGAAWVVINSSAEGKEGHLKDGAEVKAALAEQKSAPSAYLLDHDGQIGRAYGATATPHLFVIDAKGTLQYAGAIDDTPTANPDDAKKAKNYVTAALAALKAGKPVEPAQTKAYGCGVKYAY